MRQKRGLYTDSSADGGEKEHVEEEGGQNRIGESGRVGRNPS